MEAEMARRRAADPLFRWSPTPRQQPFIDSVLEGRVQSNFLVAANRSGKSDAGAYCGAMLARFGQDVKGAYGSEVTVFDRATAGWVVTVDFPVSRDVIQPKYFDNGFMAGASHEPFIPAREIKNWSVADQTLKLKGPGSGSIITFKSAESGRTKFQGAGLDWIHFDEEPPKTIYEESVIRVGAGRKLRIFMTCTLLPPEGMVGGVSWVFSEIIQPWERGENRHNTAVYGASIYDNPHIQPEEIARLESIYPEGSIQRRIRLGGEWLPGLSGSRAYGAFNRALHVRKQPAMLPRRPLCWMWDFNVEPLVSLVGQRELTLFRVYREFVLDEGNINDMVDWFREAYPTHTAEVWLYGDATGKARTGQTGQSDYQLILNAMRTYGPPVRLKVPETNPLIKDRVNAVNRQMKNEQGVINLEVDPSCRELIQDLEQVLLDPRGVIKKTNNRHDPYFRRTHPSDALGYWIVYEEPVRAFTSTPPAGRTRVSIANPSYGFTGGELRG